MYALNVETYNNLYNDDGIKCKILSDISVLTEADVLVISTYDNRAHHMYNTK